MSVYSYIEVYKPGEEGKEDNPHIGFGHGIGWTYQIAVAGGKRTYKGAVYSGDPSLGQFEEYSAMSVYKLPITKAINNYYAAIQALYSLAELDINYCANERFYRDLGLLVVAKHWLEEAEHKIPNAIVKLDWCEAVIGATKKYLAKWDTPNASFKFLVNLRRDCNQVFKGKLSLKDFSAKYPEYGTASSMAVAIEEGLL